MNYSFPSESMAVELSKRDLEKDTCWLLNVYSENLKNSKGLAKVWQAINYK
jgi:hypothetical protein